MSQGKPTDVLIKEVKVSFEPVPFRAPLKFGGRVVSSTFLINAEATVEGRNGKHATGHGSMPLGNVWAWPSATLEPTQTEQLVRAFAEEVVDLFNSYPGYGHPLEIEFDVSSEYDHQAHRVPEGLGFSEAVPPLAQLVAASPVDAAIHDAYGRMLKLNSFNTLSKEFCNTDLSEYLDDQFAGEYLDQYTLREPVPSLPLYHLIGAIDPLTEADVKERPTDKLPVTLREWIQADSLTHLKIKLAGDNLDWDIDRVLAIEKVVAGVQAARGCTEWFYSCDFNEKCDSAEYVLEFLKRVKQSSGAAFDRIQYIEQPTSRYLDADNAPRMHAVAAIKPVVIDEALTSYESLLQARELGYSGIALKACKGQSESLLMAAAAQKFGMFLCVQDLTCPGASFLHSCSLAARIPGVAAIEGNARQYCPSANAKWARKLPNSFTVKNGTIDTSRLAGLGLGFQ
ncbi:MAG TPA: mandelate racemase/muconate lactonizing enzyme family protein [Planctomycetaceae bacterium]|nr:mandelate racemase/muconate lactonizing enzyme family protein [Planctomycetaceae bacterium]HQZ68314.1 mandelate racemase/muconate lactonizing enzyme family protein [Planctomycetaceae bacterium]HRA87000.1 mandelate racemase/muconate lactonizing enzyme family protein [Planctomycetaceae bacterium]